MKITKSFSVEEVMTAREILNLVTPPRETLMGDGGYAWDQCINRIGFNLDRLTSAARAMLNVRSDLETRQFSLQSEYINYAVDCLTKSFNTYVAVVNDITVAPASDGSSYRFTAFVLQPDEPVEIYMDVSRVREKI